MKNEESGSIAAVGAFLVETEPTNTIAALPDVCRLRIFAFLAPSDLAEVAAVSTRWRDDCRNESLPQERTAVIHIPPECLHRDRLERIGVRLIAMAAATTSDGQRKFRKFSHLRVLDSQHHVSYHSGWRPPDGATIPEITALDWSREHMPVARGFLGVTHEQGVLARMLPNLREVDFSGAQGVCGCTLSHLPILCRNLEKLMWHEYPNCMCMNGIGMRNIRELYVDGACFSGFPSWGLFSHIQNSLERVSIKDAHLIHFRPEKSELLPQALLVGFVRNAPNLRWFRSDLTAKNAAILRRERPNVLFVS
jgi:hypothetical protein